MNLIDFLTGRTNLKVSGFSIVRNGIKYGYPFREAILSILPLCDEFIINVGKSDDETLDVIRSIGDEKLMIFESDWDMSLNGGQVLSVETNWLLTSARVIGVSIFRLMKFFMRNILMQ